VFTLDLWAAVAGLVIAASGGIKHRTFYGVNCELAVFWH
jgi:hypothetical protein